MKKLKINTKEKSDARRDLQKLIQKVLRKTRRTQATVEGKYTLTKRSGDLFGTLQNIQPEFKLDGDKLVMEVSMMEYYKYLDEGTKNIKPGWFFSEEIMDSKELENLAEALLYSMVDRQILDMASVIKK